MKGNRNASYIAAAAMFLLIAFYAHSALERRADNILLLLDVSQSMSGGSNFLQAQQIAAQLCEYIPKDPDIQAALRTYGHLGRVEETTRLVIPLRPFGAKYFRDTVAKIEKDKGPANPAQALEAAAKDLERAKGATAVIMLTDAKDIDREAVSRAVDELKNKSSGLCLYSIQLGSDPSAAQALKELSEQAGCGFSTSADLLQYKDKVKLFVELVFYEETENDSDKDRVIDKLDHCPNTPWGAAVDERGCWVLREVQFDTGSAVIKPEHYAILHEVASILKANPDLRLEIQGHTDNEGEEDYNLNLSKKRADAVREFLVQQGIEYSRLRAAGYGESQPVASNDSPEGRAKNRRIELRPLD